MNIKALIVVLLTFCAIMTYLFYPEHAPIKRINAGDSAVSEQPLLDRESRATMELMKEILQLRKEQAAMHEKYGQLLQEKSGLNSRMQNLEDELFRAKNERVVAENIPPAGGTQGNGNEESITERNIDISSLQSNLDALGYNPGPVDGKVGPKTKEAIGVFESDLGLSPDSVPLHVLSVISQRFKVYSLVTPDLKSRYQNISLNSWINAQPKDSADQYRKIFREKNDLKISQMLEEYIKYLIDQ